MRNMTIKQKLFGMTILLSVMMVGLSIFFVNRYAAMGKTYQQISSDRIPQLVTTNAIGNVLLNIRVNLNELNSVARNKDNFIVYSQRVRDKFEIYEKLENVLLNGHKELGLIEEDLAGIAVLPCRKGGQIEALTKELGRQFLKYKELAQNIIAEKEKQLDVVETIGWYDNSENSQGVTKILVENGRKMEALTKTMEEKLLVAEIRRQEKNILQRADQRYIKRLREAMMSLNRNITGEMQQVAKGYSDAFESISDKVITLKLIDDNIKEKIRGDLRKKQKELDDTVNDLKKRAQTQMVQYATEAVQMEKTAGTLILVVCTIVIFLGLTVGWFMSNGINKVLNRIIQNLKMGAGEIASASEQVSAASQSLAEGASEQAASIEETSSSLEEMAAMTKQNAGNADQANDLMAEAKTIVGKSNDAITELTQSMMEISQASEETSKIIKNIDEIAFQTNLLALNAAVEAARAGEAGAGFAVVADEVRNLAIRAADAASSTSELIEGTVKKIHNGSDILSRTNEAFSEVSISALKVSELVAEIAAASNQQAQGVEQINTAVTDMDRVIQSNASSAEESASASEELNAQAQQMNLMVKDLAAMVGGGQQIQEPLRYDKQKDQTHLPPKSRPKISYQNKRVLGDEVAPDKVLSLSDVDLDIF